MDLRARAGHFSAPGRTSGVWWRPVIRRRAADADHRALLTNLELLILDEATEGLAPLIAEDIWRILREIRATGIATVIVDKNHAAVAAISDRTVILVKGRVVFEGSSRELQAQPELTQKYLGI